MNLGICTWMFGDIRLEQVLPTLAQCGADGIELLGKHEPAEGQRIRRLLVNENLSVFSLTPIDVDRQGHEIDLAHPNHAIRQHSIDTYREMLDLAASVGAPILGCHGRVGRVNALTTQADEELLLIDSLHLIAEHAMSLDVCAAFEVLNRYETHMACTVEAGMELIANADSPSLGLLLDTYHMNIEEASLPRAIEAASKHMILLHVADSNRRAPGLGHVPFSQVFEAIQTTRYTGPWIVECTSPGPNPFAVAPASYDRTTEEVTRAISYLRGLEA